MVLSRGNTLDYAEMYRGLAGHDPQIQPYLDYYGLNGGAARHRRAPAASSGSGAGAGADARTSERG